MICYITERTEGADSVKYLFLYNDNALHVHHHIDVHPKDDDYAIHIHDQYELMCFIQGSAVFLVEGTVYPLVPGSIILMRPTESHRIKILADVPYERYVINFYPEILAQTDPDALLLEAFQNRSLGCQNLYTPSDFQNENRLKYIESICTSNENMQEQRLAILTYLFPLLHEIREVYTRKTLLDKDFPFRQQTQQFIDYVNRHLTDEISLNSLAEHFFLSTSQFNRLFKKGTGSSVWAYITIKRLMFARTQIQNGVSATDAAMACGFRDYSCFYRAYVNHFGRTPRQDANSPDKELSGLYTKSSTRHSSSHSK